jgi:two-component sensor histidine kinase
MTTSGELTEMQAPPGSSQRSNESVAEAARGGTATAGGSHSPLRSKPAHRVFPLSLLLSLLTLAAMMPLLLLAGYFVHGTVQEQREAEMRQLSELAADLARSVDRELRGHIETALVLSGSRYLRQGDLLAFWEHAEDAASRADGHFILLDETHQQLVNTRLSIGTPLPRSGDRAGVDETLRTGTIQVGNIHVGAVEQQQVFSVRLPVEAAGGRRHVLSYVPRSDAILDVVNDAYRPEGWFAAVVDGNGAIVARSHRHDEFFGQTVTPLLLSQLTSPEKILETVDLEGRNSLTAKYASQLSSWTVFVWAPRAMIEGPAQEAQRVLALLVAFALATSIAAAYFAGRLIREPNLRLLRAARDLGRGRQVRFTPSLMREANVVGEALVEAGRIIDARESALRDADGQIRIVMQELSHRSKNLLAVVQAMVSQSARFSPDFDHFQTRFRERLGGLSRSHDLLVQMDWTSIPMKELVLSQLEPFTERLDHRIALEGPALMLKPQAAQSLGLALHELGTNAMKYGALSTPNGRVVIAWSQRIDENGAEFVRLRWEETGGPAVSTPTRKGFGSVVIEKIAPASVHGQASTEWRPEGLVWEVEAPASFVV